MSTSAHERPCWQSKCAARDIANSLFQKWAIKGFFPAGERREPRTRTARRATAGRSPRRKAGRAASGVAVPLAFFCTLFFRHRKKSVSAPWDGQSLSAPESARQAPPRGFAYSKVVAYKLLAGGFPLAPCTPHRALWARGCSGEMRPGRGFTAARRQASRLAGLVRLPAAWPIQTAIRRRASWLAPPNPLAVLPYNE